MIAAAILETAMPLSSIISLHFNGTDTTYSRHVEVGGNGRWVGATVSGRTRTSLNLYGRLSVGQRERRDETRVPAKFTVDYVHDGDYVISLSRDISADGMFVYSNNPLEIGKRSSLTFSIGDLHGVEVRAEVVWVNTDGPERDHGMGVRFIKPSAKLREQILRSINKVAILEKGFHI